MNFQELMDSYHFNEYESNEYRYKLLLEKMKKHRILPVIGSGLSCWAFPSWHEFLLDLASRSSVEEEARELLKKGRYTECATLLESDLGYDLARIVCDRYTFHGDDELKRPEYQKLIPLLFPRGAVTTNVDQSLETLYKNPYVLNPAPEEEMYSRFMDAALSARRQQAILGKLHGTVWDLENMIVTQRNFDRFYELNEEKNNFRHPFASDMHNTVRGSCLLFLGCSLSNDTSYRVFKACPHELTYSQQHENFALLEMPDEEYTYPDNDRMDFISDLNIRVIWYPHEKHECIGILLTQLAIDLGIIEDPTQSQEVNKMTSNRATNTKQKVFIVHGHDNAAKQEMARTLENAGFEAIILHEQADTGLTIIEKIERYTDVNYAVVLYTECDLGRSKKDPVEKERNRARQNVVFEHGYLIGKLGRDHVSALVKGNVETPGDISGVVYTRMDEDGAWKMVLARNMKAIGLDVDMNVFCR